MTDPVAEAAAQIAAQHAEPTLLEAAMNTIHDLEAKVEHLIHPDAEAGTATAGETAAAPVEAAPVDTSAMTSAAAVESVATPAAAELPNAAPTPPVGAATAAAGDVPNAASAVAEPTAEAASAPSADGANTTSPIAASSAEPLHVSIATHLEAIYTLARDHVAAAPAAAVADTNALKTHVGDILHRISNGMSVTEGELVTKLEALYRML